MKLNLLILMMLFFSCGGGESKEQSGGGAQAKEQATAVRVVQVEEQKLVFYESFPGTVTPLERVEVRPQVSGYITARHFRDGERVVKGQRLYTFDVRQYQAEVNQAEAGIEAARANVALAEKNVARYRRLAEAEAIATQTLDQSEAELESRQQALNQAEAQLNSAQTQLDYASIRAPLTGLTGLGSAKVGTQVSPGSPVLTEITRQEPVGVDFALPQQEIPRFARFEAMSAAELDSTFRLRLPDGTLYGIPGEIYATEQTVDSRTGSLTVRLQFDNKANILRNGMTVSVEVLNQQSGRQLTVPSQALAEQMGEFYVYRVQDSMAFRQNVKTGEQVRDMQIILDGVEAGDTIIAEGLKAIRDSSRVRIQSAKN
ncbi:efflux RND transporter periplasmic adaptor subunit [Lewinella sp. IMCC34191]|uniref:efflux RND transporter periplasmic adaptor subunit n=1 Tax=Lewinella sp. IMCC34191 TaxID=2259172 RepID=UPI000E2809A5|nr:efflux RND transporter periplasmic adaptor subunit [Lewinella sp. IMCC34191]